MKKKSDSQEPRPEAESEEAKNFQNLVEKVLSVPKEEIDRREKELREKKDN